MKIDTKKIREWLLPHKKEGKFGWVSFVFESVGTLILIYLLYLVLTVYKPYMETINTCEAYYQEKMRQRYEKFNMTFDTNMTWGDLPEDMCPPCQCLNQLPYTTK